MNVRIDKSQIPNPKSHVLISSLVFGICAALVAVRLHAQAASPPSPAAAANSGITFTTHLEKTAVWVGDQFHYRIFVDHPPEVQFIVDNINRDTINLDPLRVVNATATTMALTDRRQRLAVDLTVASFATGVTDVQIPQLSLFYFRRQGASASPGGNTAAAESLTIPGPVIAVRSTLPPRPTDVRDAITVTGWPRSRWIVAAVGWSAAVLLVAGLGWRAAHLFRGRRRREGPDPRKAMRAVRERWLESVPADFADPRAVSEFYGRSYRDLKEYLGYLLETPTEGLLADELRAEMTRRAASADLTERSVKVLSVCETARYAAHPAALNSTTARELADDMRAILHSS